MTLYNDNVDEFIKMKKKSKIILITNSFPFGEREPLIKNELSHLRGGFDEVSIVCLSRPQEFINQDLLKGEAVLAYDVSISIFSKIKGLVMLNWFQIYTELLYVKKVYQLPLTLAIFKVVIMAGIRGVKFKRFIKSNFKDDLKNKNMTFYSWWCIDEVIGLANLKKHNNSLKLFSRMHAYDLYFERYKPNYLPFRGIVFEKFNRIFVISKQGKDYLENKLDRVLPNLSVLKLGVKNNFELPDRKYNDGKLLIVSCSSLIPLKRIHLIIEALSEVNTSIEVNWIHFGIGPSSNILKELGRIKLDELSNIKYDFYGGINNEELHRFYLENSVDLFLNVSETEGIPISIMEAMSYGVPCVGTDVGGVSELISNDVNGFLLTKDFAVSELVNVFDKVASWSLLEQKNKSRSAYKMWNENFNSDKNNSTLVNEMVEF